MIREEAIKFKEISFTKAETALKGGQPERRSKAKIRELCKWIQ